jgi:hypothetical protein
MYTDPLGTEVVRIMYSPYFTDNTIRDHYKDQQAVAVYGNNCCLLSELQEMYKHCEGKSQAILM